MQRMPKQALTACVLVTAVLVTLGMEAPNSKGVGIGGPVATPAVQAQPFIRAEVPAKGEIRLPIEVTLAQPATLLTAEVDCRCVSLIEPTPRPLPAGRSTLTLRVVGLLPGTKRVTLRTTAGIAEIVVQVAVPGADSGMSVLRNMAAEAQREHERLVVIVHRIAGHLRNCGCASGSLGGIDHLAGLPAVLRDLGATDARCVLTGDIAGTHAGLEAELAKRGWEIHPVDLPVSAEPVALLGQTGLLAVIDTSNGMPIANQRVIRPLLDGGAAATVLRIGADGRITNQQLLPIDQSLPADASILATFPEARTLQIVAEAQAERCATCHPAPAQAWNSSKHAHAWASLKPEQQVDACITCHSSPGNAGGLSTARVPEVSCVACHNGAQAHADAGGTLHTTGVIDCRSCHDSMHHPGFDRTAGWERIRHGR